MVYPKEGPTNKETGRRCERFGPLESFSLDLSDKKVVQVRAQSRLAGDGAQPRLLRAAAETVGRVALVQ